MTFTSIFNSPIFPGFAGHLHLGDNNGDGSPDLLNHGGGCCSSPYRISFGGAPFDLVSIDVVPGFNTPTTFTANTGAAVVVPGIAGAFVFPEGFTGVTEVIWDAETPNLFGFQTIDDLVFIGGGPGTVTLAGPLLKAINAFFAIGGRFLDIQNDMLIQTGPDPLVILEGGSMDVGLELVRLRGSATAVDAETGLTLGTDRPLQPSGVVFETVGATVSAQKAFTIDTALLEASAPLLNLRPSNPGSNFTTSADAIDLSLRAKVTSLGPLVRLDASTMNVNNGALARVAGGSFLKVTGDLLDLRNGSTLNLLNGPIMNVGGGSVASISGALVAFTGVGNTINITNHFCPGGTCDLIGGLRVARTGGPTVNIANPVKNLAGNAINLSANAAHIVVEGATSRVTISGN
jgi:hypothetical protein